MASQPSPPTGTVTFLFTDIEGSTVAWERERLVMESALQRHDEIVRSAVAARGGYVFAVTGDGFGAAFGRAEQAVEAAGDVLRLLAAEVWPGGLEVRVRMGLHTGEAQERDGNFFGPALNRAARVMGLAAGGQVLVSDATQRVVADRLVSGLELVAAGEVVLRGVEHPVEVFDLVVDGVGGPVDGLARVRARHGNLPVELVELVGRNQEVTAVGDALLAHRLVTVIGIGGVGKTALALQAAAGWESDAWLVELAQVGDRSQVASAVGQALGVSASPGFSVTDAVIEWSRRRPVLLVLDNCEHVLDEVARLAEELIGAAPEVRVLATSREPLFAKGEHLVPLAPLSVDDDGGAVELFYQRAAEVNPEFAESADRAAVAELCRRLDGLPLAVELAAARMRSLQPGDVLDHLDERFRLLTGGRRTAVERHQTLRAAVGWSYDLLDSVERRVFENLSVFAGRFSLDDAVAVVAGAGIDELDVVDHVARLVDRSLLDTADTGPRFGMLETVRAFGREQLEASGRADDVRRFHAHRFLGLAEAARAACPGPEEMMVFDETMRRAGDYQAAVEWAAHSDELPTAIEIVLALVYCGGLWSWFKAVTWLQSTIEQPPDPRPAQWPALLAAHAEYLHNEIGDFDEAATMAAKVLELDPGDPRALTVQMEASVARGDYQEVSRYAPLVTEAAQARGSRNLELGGLLVRALVARSEDRDGYVRDLEQESARDRSPTFMALAMLQRAGLEMDSDPEGARQHLEAALELAIQGASPLAELAARREVASSRVDTDPQAAAAGFADTLDRIVDVGRMQNAHRVCRMAAVLLARHHKQETAALIAGHSGLNPTTPAEARQFAQLQETLAAELGDRHNAALQRGAATGLAEIIEITTNELRDLTAQPE